MSPRSVRHVFSRGGVLTVLSVFLCNMMLSNLSPSNLRIDFVSKGLIDTLATNDAGKCDLTVSIVKGSITLKIDVDLSGVANTVLDATPSYLFTVDKLLIPTESFRKSPSPALAPKLASSFS